MKQILKLGRVFFAIGIAAFCIHQLIYADLRPVLMITWPSWMPGLHVISYIVNVFLIIACIEIIFGKNGASAALLVGTGLLLSVLINHLPYQLCTNLHFIAGWSDTLKALAISGGAFAVAGSLMAEEISQGATLFKVIRPLNRVVPFAKIFFSVTIIIFGIEHFIYGGFVETLVPSWIPWHPFWTYFAGIALIASGLAILLNVKARLAAILLGIMIFIWFAILHIPRGIADPYSGNGNELRSVFESLAFSGIAFVLAGTLNKKSTVQQP